MRKGLLEDEQATPPGLYRVPLQVDDIGNHPG
jgi:hypothetical protein